MTFSINSNAFLGRGGFAGQCWRRWHSRMQVWPGIENYRREVRSAAKFRSDGAGQRGRGNRSQLRDNLIQNSPEAFHYSYNKESSNPRARGSGYYAADH